MTTGMKTSEFWLVLVFMVGSFLMLGLKVVTPEEIIALLGTALPVAGYAVSRGIKKSGGSE